jgi:hypothetical protein
MSSAKISSDFSSTRRRRTAVSGSKKRNWLILWRSASTTALRAIPSIDKDLLAFLATHFVPQSSEETQLLDAMLRGSEIGR